MHESSSLRRRAACCICGIALAASVLSAAELPEGFRLEPVVDGLFEPSAMTETPDGRILIVGRFGQLYIVQDGQLLDPSPTTTCSITVDTRGDRGLHGIALHPDFDGNGYIYLHSNARVTGKNRVTRQYLFRNRCYWETDILTDLGSSGPFGSGLRNGGGIAFGADGKLYLVVGDMDDPGNGQDDQVLQAKVLRYNDDGTIPSDNPDPTSPIYALGVRDGSGLTVDPAGRIYLVDRGDALGIGYDELNLVSAGANFGWADESGPGGIHDPPLAAWNSTFGVRRVAGYDGNLFPDADADGLDNDGDSYGVDGGPGVLHADDNSLGECIGSGRNGLPCAGVGDCAPTRAGETTSCEWMDDVAEYCPGGMPLGDDDCDDVGEAGIDEPDESFPLDIFATGETRIGRAALFGSQDQLGSWTTFMDSSFLSDCPSGWRGVLAGRDGYLYVLARNNGAFNGALYRIVYDGGVGPREVSGPGSYVPLQVRRDGSDVQISWEDIRDDAMQPQWSGFTSTGLAREYTIWRGELGNYYTHVPFLDAVAGTEVNGITRVLSVDADGDYYFLVSARSDNREGTLGNGTAGERPGFPVTDICETLGEYSSPWPLFACGRDFELIDTRGETRRLHEFRGKAVLISFCAEWAADCAAQADRLESIWRDYKSRDVQVLSVLVDEESPTQDWDGRPTPAECRLWQIRNPSPDHTFECWADPQHCTGEPCNDDYDQEAWPLYDRYGSVPTTVILNQGLGVAWSSDSWDEAAIREKLDEVAGSTDSCLHCSMPATSAPPEHVAID